MNIKIVKELPTPTEATTKDGKTMYVYEIPVDVTVWSNSKAKAPVAVYQDQRGFWRLTEVN